MQPGWDRPRAPPVVAVAAAERVYTRVRTSVYTAERGSRRDNLEREAKVSR